ncbi:MAG: hypothetical protein K2P94_15160 [Rhodospirillaceae bacterium]|nr:hypothetical protein [Rhodospirillaceae bacterium]
MTRAAYRSIFAVGTAQERAENFETYFAFSTKHSGEIIEADKDLVNKRATLKWFQDNPVRSKKPLPDPQAFYRNYVDLKDDPKTLDKRTLLLTCVYKFARHEWVGITGAWDATPPIAQARNLEDRIGRYHLAEEFCHVRLFHEMFRTMQLEDVVWQPLGPVMQTIYRMFPYFPGWMMDAPAFVTELMGIVFYRHLDGLLDEYFGDEPEARDRIRALLREITVDEVAHAGQRRNFIGPAGTVFAKIIVRPLFKAFFHDIPGSELVFNVEQMIKDAQDFDYSLVAPDMMAQSWVPSYCRQPEAGTALAAE